jgi:hypothetical protein
MAGDDGVEDVARRAGGSLQQVLRRVGLCHESIDFTPVSHPS